MKKRIIHKRTITSDHACSKTGYAVNFVCCSYRWTRVTCTRETEGQMTPHTKHSGGERGKAIELAKALRDRMRPLLYSDRPSSEAILARALLAEVEAHERTKSDYQGAMNCCADLTAMHERAEKAESGMRYLNAALGVATDEAEKFGDKLQRAYAETRAAREKIAHLEANNNRTHGGPNCVSAVEHNALKSQVEQLQAACAVKDLAFTEMLRSRTCSTQIATLANKALAYAAY